VAAHAEADGIDGLKVIDLFFGQTACNFKHSNFVFLGNGRAGERFDHMALNLGLLSWISKRRETRNLDH
jgi:thiamine pyrophosphokinase